MLLRMGRCYSAVLSEVACCPFFPTSYLFVYIYWFIATNLCNNISLFCAFIGPSARAATDNVHTHTHRRGTGIRGSIYTTFASSSIPLCALPLAPQFPVTRPNHKLSPFWPRGAGWGPAQLLQHFLLRCIPSIYPALGPLCTGASCDVGVCAIHPVGPVYALFLFVFFVRFVSVGPSEAATLRRGHYTSDIRTQIPNGATRSHFCAPHPDDSPPLPVSILPLLRPLLSCEFQRSVPPCFFFF